MGYHTVHPGKDNRTDEQKEWDRERTPEDLHCVITEDDVYRYRVDCRDHMNRHLGCVAYSDFLWIARIKATLMLNRERKNLLKKTEPKKELRIIVK